ncbi:MAG TPA: prepilin-type N-terminal cleavage/methylation domain-containing protein [Candidatus Paceibacterota bacterium]|nr:prepilin-type N-terminal cleavage/methylation domain-containing protein [Candidatus Paceibacterota bacterium]
MNTKDRVGFTLIEILIVVAIIAILASVVLVGLGPTQEAGRDARRISDLSEVQNGLELYYNKCGIYPGTGTCAAGDPTGGWLGLGNAVIGANVGIVSAFPNDPTASKSYSYWYGANNTTYVIGATLENTSNAVFTGYNPPTPGTLMSGLTGVHPTDCTSVGNYCTTL